MNHFGHTSSVFNTDNRDKLPFYFFLGFDYVRFFNFQDGFLEHYLLKLLGKARLRKFVTGHRASLADITALSGQTKLKLLLLLLLI